MSYSSINCARSAIASLNIDGNDVSYNSLIKRFMKGVFHLRPSFPRYNNTWNPDLVLKFLKTWHPADKITIKQLTIKTAVLLVLISGRRGNTITNLYSSNIRFNEEGARISISELCKTSTVGKHDPEIIISKFNREEICCVRYLENYLSRTAHLRTTSSKLFLSFVKPFKPVTTSTLARWVRHVMTQAGIDTTIFKPHSTRSAATSKAYHNNVSLATILASVGWRSESTFGRHYEKSTIKNQGDFLKALEPSD